jgi:molecular chaperone DnaK
VTFDIDANGIVHVSAKDKATQKEQKITIQSSGGLSDAQVEEMVRDAEAAKEKDEARRAMVDAKNEADSLVYSAEKSLNEHKDKLSAGTVEAIQSAMAEAREAGGTEDLDRVKAAVEALRTAVMKIGEETYGSAQAQEAGKEKEAEFAEKEKENEEKK